LRKVQRRDAPAKVVRETPINLSEEGYFWHRAEAALDAHLRDLQAEFGCRRYPQLILTRHNGAIEGRR
jgi:hypothetical protein